jgi:L-asparagine transporter-like permease
VVEFQSWQSQQHSREDICVNATFAVILFAFLAEALDLFVDYKHLSLYMTVSVVTIACSYHRSCFQSRRVRRVLLTPADQGAALHSVAAVLFGIFLSDSTMAVQSAVVILLAVSHKLMRLRFASTLCLCALTWVSWIVRIIQMESVNDHDENLWKYQLFACAAMFLSTLSAKQGDLMDLKSEG